MPLPFRVDYVIARNFGGWVSTSSPLHGISHPSFQVCGAKCAMRMTVFVDKGNNPTMTTMSQISNNKACVITQQSSVIKNLVCVIIKEIALSKGRVTGSKEQ